MPRVSAILELDETMSVGSVPATTARICTPRKPPLRSFVVRLGDVAVDGTRDPRESWRRSSRP